MPKRLETIEDVEEFCETYWDIITSDKVSEEDKAILRKTLEQLQQAVEICVNKYRTNSR